MWVALATIEPESLLLVAADLEPMVGSTDVAIPAEAVCGAMTLRCGFEIQCQVSKLRQARRTSRLDSDDLERARHKRAQIEAGALVAGRLEQESDTDPIYQDWLEEGPARARAALEDLLGAEEESSSDSLFYVEGISQMVEWAREERIDPDLMRLLQHVHRVSSQPHLGLPAGANPRDLAATGWALVISSDESPAVREALDPLFRHRQGVAGEKAKILDYRPGENWRSWLARHDVAPGRAQPSKVPHYLLLAGDPAAIPYDLQNALNVEYAVGRLSFETVEEYRRYADSLIRHETAAEAEREKTAVFFVSAGQGLNWPVGADASVQGLIAVLYTSYSAGTYEPSVADLPRRLLGHPAGSAASVVGFLGQVQGPAISQQNEPVLGGLFEALLAGLPVGHAVWEFKKRYAALSVQLREMQQKMRRGAVVGEVDVAVTWSLRNEARDIVVLGDPVARLQPNRQIDP